MSLGRIWHVRTETGVVANRVSNGSGKPGKAAGPAGLCENWSGGPLRGLRENRERGSGKERLAGPGSATCRVSAHCRIGVRKSFFFFKYFHNLQTNLNSNFDDFYSQNKIQEHFTTPGKLCNGMNATNNHLFKYITV
jgi:hypothetical protein